MSDNADTATTEKIRKRLKNKALHYLERYASTEAKLAETLKRFAIRKLSQYSAADIEPHIAYTVSQCVSLGYIDDEAFAQTKWDSGLRSGRSPQWLAQKLRLAGIHNDIISALREAEAEDPDSELRAAIISARKRRIGPFARVIPTEFADKQKHMARLVRAGFSLSIARHVMAFESPDAAEDYQS